MRNISTTVRGHYDNDMCMWAIIIRMFCDIFLTFGLIKTISIDRTFMHGCVLRERMIVDFCLRVSMHGVLIRRF
jgi:hypothetical protein